MKLTKYYRNGWVSANKGVKMSLPPRGQHCLRQARGDHEVVEGESATIKFVLPMGIALLIHYRLVFRSVPTFFFRRLPQSPSVTAPSRREPKLDPRFEGYFKSVHTFVNLFPTSPKVNVVTSPKGKAHCASAMVG